MLRAGIVTARYHLCEKELVDISTGGLRLCCGDAVARGQFISLYCSGYALEKFAQGFDVVDLVATRLPMGQHLYAEPRRSPARPPTPLCVFARASLFEKPPGSCPNPHSNIVDPTGRSPGSVPVDAVRPGRSAAIGRRCRGHGDEEGDVPRCWREKRDRGGERGCCCGSDWAPFCGDLVQNDCYACTGWLSGGRLFVDFLCSWVSRH